MSVIVSNKWRNKIAIKEQFQDETTPELVEQLCDSLIKQLFKLRDKELNAKDTDSDTKIYIEDKINEIIDHFEFLRDLSNGTIKEEDFDNYGFDGDHEEWFNDYLSELYDLGDDRIITTANISEKFLWID